MAVRHYLIGTLAAILVVSSISSSATNENDGGMGIDAGNTVASALELTSLASVAGTLSAVDDRDWYYEDTVDSAAPVCMDARLVSEHASTVRLSVVSGTSVREAVGNYGGYTGIAAPGYAGAFYEVSGEATTLPPLRPYTVTSTLTALPSSLPTNNDGASGTDASPSNPVAIATGCVFGATKTSQGDASDVYTFAGTVGDGVVLSLMSQSSSGQLALTSPTGAPLADFASGALASITLPETGTYTLTASSTSNGLNPYVIGVCEPKCKPPRQPCEPMCIDLVQDI